MGTPRERSIQESCKQVETRTCKTISKARSVRSSAVQRSLSIVVRSSSPLTDLSAQAETERPPDIVIQGTIPDVLRWARKRIDAHPESLQGTETLSGARSLARQILLEENVIIALNDLDYWKAESRLWENVYAYAVKLPGNGKSCSIFDTMSRYPSSVLVYRGLKYIFGRSVVIAGKKTPRLTLDKNALVVFSPCGSEDSLAKKWFDDTTLPRMQEMVVHMCAISEYVLRCAYMAKRRHEMEEHDEYGFLRLLECRLRADRDFKNRETLRFEPWNSLSELSVQDVFPCLQQSINAAHLAVIEGARIASRKYGQRESRGKERRKIQLWMLRRPLSDVMDSLVRRLEVIVSEILGSSVDIDDFRLKVMRLLRTAEKIYQDVGIIWFDADVDFRAPKQLPKGADALISSAQYTFRFSY